jgi:hypothetical protein
MSIAYKLKAVVRNGRLTLDEPTDLPEGQVIELVSADDPYAYLDEEDEMDEEERVKLDAAIERSWAQAQAGQTRPAEELLAELRQRG